MGRGRGGEWVFEGKRSLRSLVQFWSVILSGSFLVRIGVVVTIGREIELHTIWKTGLNEILLSEV